MVPFCTFLYGKSVSNRIALDMPRFFSYKQNWVKISIEWIFECSGFLVEKIHFEPCYLLLMNISWLQMNQLLIIKDWKHSKVMPSMTILQQFVWFVWLCSYTHTVLWLVCGYLKRKTNQPKFVYHMCAIITCSLHIFYTLHCLDITT